MTPYLQPEQTHRAPWFGFVALGMLLMALNVVHADASSLGGLTSPTLTASRMMQPTLAPTVIAWDNFNAANGTNLNGRTTTGGARTWSAVSGTWRAQGNRADTSYVDAALVLNASTAFASVEATTYRGGTTFDVGVVSNMNAAGTQFLTAELTHFNNGEIQLWMYNGGWSQLASVSNLFGPNTATWPSSTRVRMTSGAGGVLTVSLDDVVTISHTLTAPQQTTFQNASHQRFGLYSYYDGASRWDDVHVDTP